MLISDIVIGIDPGETESGVVIINNMTRIEGMIIPNDKVLKLIRTIAVKHSILVAFEDLINPYPGMRAETITTCKFIGVIEYVTGKMRSVTATGYVRSKVRQWVYDTFPDVVAPRVVDKIIYLDKKHDRMQQRDRLKAQEAGKEFIPTRNPMRTKEGELRKPSFVYVDDRMIIAAMKVRFDIPTPKPGKPNVYGLRSHSWQALAVAAMSIAVKHDKPKT